MTEEEIKDIENSLKEGELIDSDDSLEITEKGDYWEKFLIFNSQVRGYYYFTKKRIVFIGGFAGSTKFSVPYKSIKNIKKCNVGLFIPCGVLITAFDDKKMKDVKYKLSLLKRDKWISFFEEKMNNN